jgi:outer membrane immunogenic protein
MKMNKIILSISLLVITAISAKAQIKFGIKGGMNVSSISNTSSYEYQIPNNSPKFTARIGYNIGAFANIHLKGLFSLETEAYYSLEGAKNNFSVTDQYGNILSDHGVQDLSYLQIPVMARITFWKKRLYAELGPQIGFLLSAKDKPAGEKTIDDKSDFNTVDCAFVTSIGIMFPAGIGFNLRYNEGVIPVFKNTDISYQTNSTFQVNAFYQFGGNKSKD